MVEGNVGGSHVLGGKRGSEEPFRGSERVDAVLLEDVLENVRGSFRARVSFKF